MEKQPIDDFFARKLRDAEQLPSPATFSRLQSRMASTKLPRKQRQMPLWWYGAAASLLLITLLFYRNNVKAVIGVTQQEVAKQNKTDRVLDPTQKASQLMANAEKKLMPQRSVALEKEEERSRPREHSTIASVARKEVTSTVAIVQKQTEPTSRAKPVLSSPALVEQETIAAVPQSPLSVPAAQPTQPVTTKSTEPQRVVVLTIDVPSVESPIVALQPTKVESTAQTQAGNLAGLLAKVKQLKNGDMLASATSAKRPIEPRSRFGRVFEGVKESLKNETTLE